MKMLLLIPFLVTSISCLVTSSWSLFQRYDLPTTFRYLVLSEKDAHHDFLSPLSKRTNAAPTDADVNAYLARCPHNQIPDYVTVNRNRDGLENVIYSRVEIWNAMNAGIQQYNRWIANPSEETNPRLSYTRSGRRYPHILTGREMQIRDVNIGDATRPLWIWPIWHSPTGRNIWGGGIDNPGYDRVAFDANGYYVGILTHRGEADNEFHWGSPTDAASRALAAVDLTNVPGVPVHTVYNGPRQQNQVLNGFVDAAAPPISPWNLIGPGGGNPGFHGSGL